MQPGKSSVDLKPLRGVELPRHFDLLNVQTRKRQFKQVPIFVYCELHEEAAQASPPSGKGRISFTSCKATVAVSRRKNGGKWPRIELFPSILTEMQSMSSAYKPSPLGYGSQRSSPFRRPQSPASPSTLRQTTPAASPTKQGPSDAGARFTRSPVTSPKQEFRTPRGHPAAEDATDPYFPQQRTTPRPAAVASAVGHGSALSQLQPSQARTMREAFQLLDRDSDGVVNREDVTDMLSQLGRFPSRCSPEGRAC